MGALFLAFLVHCVDDIAAKFLTLTLSLVIHVEHNHLSRRVTLW